MHWMVTLQSYILRIVFFGTPEFAVPSLDALIKNGFEIIGVVTAPDKPSGRGLKVHQSAIKLYALSHQLPILQPEKLKDLIFEAQLRAWKADIQIVIAFRMLPESVWNMPPLGTLNLHASLLPLYRGAAPINRAIMNGERVTGLTTFFLKYEIDTGNIILQRTIDIEPKETAGSLHDRMMLIGAELVTETLHLISEKNYQVVEQIANSEIKLAPKIYKEDCKINWNQSAINIYNQIRGLSPHPAAFCMFKNETLKIYNAEYKEMQHSDSLGSFSILNGQIKVACKDGYIFLLEVQLQGKKRMDIQHFLMGFRPTVMQFD